MLETVLIGWDGATFTLLDPLMNKGVMPNLGRALKGGSRATLTSIVPPLTPPAWTSLITGRSPGYHGVFDFFQKESADSIHLRLTTLQNVRAEPLWTMLNRLGKRVTTLNFPVTFPPPMIQGYAISGGWLTRRQLRMACHPKDLYDTIRSIEGMEPAELITDLSEEAKAIEGCSEHETIEFIEKHIRRERQWCSILTHLLDEDPTEFVSIVFDGTDKIQHLCWPVLAAFAQGDHGTPSVNGVLEACLEYYRELDRLLGSILDRLGPETHLFLVSDHGFGESRDLFFINQWLSNEGFLAWKQSKAPVAVAGTSLGMTHLARHPFEMDWTMTKAFCATPSSNGIHIVTMNRHAGISRCDDAEREAAATTIIEKLVALRSPSTGERLIHRVWRRREAFPGPYGNLAPDLTLSLWDGGLVSILASHESIQTRQRPVGAHRPEGIFIAMGPAFSPHESLKPISLLDVAPMVLHVLGLPIPTSMEGKIMAEVFARGFLERHPTTYTTERRLDPQISSIHAEEPLITEEDERIIAERLRQLGYLE